MNESDNKNQLLVLSIISLLYIGVCLTWVSFRPKGVFWTIDEGGKLVFLQNIIKQGDIFAPIEYPGRDLDPDFRFVPFTYTNLRMGELRTWWLPLFSIITVPFYHWLGWIGLYVLPAVGGSLTLFASGLIVRMVSPESKWLPIVTSVLIGVATPIAFYSVMFWEHTLAVAAALLSVSFVLRWRSTRSATNLVWGGLTGAFAFALRTEVIFILVSLGIILLFYDWRKGIVFGLSFVICSLPFFYLNYRIFGHPINVHLGTFATANNFALFSKFGASFLAYFLFNPPVVWTYHLGAISLAVGTSGFLVAFLGAFLKQYRWVMFLGLAALLFICVRVLISSYGYRSLQGFVLDAPYIALVPLYFSSWKEKSRAFFTQFVLISIVVYGAAYLYKAWIGAGGLQWGTRYLLVFYPLFTILIVIGIADQWKALSRTLQKGVLVGAILSFLVGFGYQVRGAISVLEVMRFYEAAKPGLALLSDRPVVTSYCDPALIMDGKYWNQKIFSVTWTGLEAWIEHAKKMKIPAFYVVSLDICTPSPLHVVRENRTKNPYGLSVVLYSSPDYRPEPYKLYK